MTRMDNMKMILVGIIVIMVASGYFIFQCASVVAYSSFSRNIVVATRLLTVELLNINRTTLAEGDFALLLTFENPTTNTLNVTSIVSDYYIMQGEVSVFTGRGSTTVPRELGSGRTEVVLPMFTVSGQISTPVQFQCIVYYRLEFGSAHYRFEYFAYDSVVDTTGPYILGGEDQVFPQVATYTLQVIDVWAVGLEIIGALIIFRDTLSSGGGLVREAERHRKMTAIIYALQGMGLFIFFPFVSLLIGLVAPPTHVYSSSGGWSSFIFIGFTELAGLILLSIAWGLLMGKRGAMYAALSASSIIVFLSLYAGSSILTPSTTGQDFALVILSFATLVANVIAFYILLKR